MKTSARNEIENCAPGPVWPSMWLPARGASNLHLVTAFELQDLRHALARGDVPSDLEAKLNSLAMGNLGHRFIEQNCRTLIALIQAVEDGVFKAASPAECEWLLRVLAYVRADDDAIPDYRPDGFADDQQEVRAATHALSPLLQAFKSWRLRHQVPRMWLARSSRHGRLSAELPYAVPLP
jgi:hypothetical protein